MDSKAQHLDFALVVLVIMWFKFMKEKDLPLHSIVFGWACPVCSVIACLYLATLLFQQWFS